MLNDVFLLEILLMLNSQILLRSMHPPGGAEKKQEMLILFLIRLRNTLLMILQKRVEGGKTVSQLFKI